MPRDRSDDDAFDRFTPRERGRFGDDEYGDRDKVQRARLADVECALVHETKLALLITRDSTEVGAVWVPKEPCEIERKGTSVSVKLKTGGLRQCQALVVTMPKRLAMEKGLI